MIKFYGFAGHHILSPRCAFHLSTSIDGVYLVSTIGRYLDENEEVQDICIGYKYQTMVFEIEGEDSNGDPLITSYSEIDSRRYNYSRVAEDGHYEMMDKYMKKHAKDSSISSSGNRFKIWFPFLVQS